jgi:predicted nucleic acid-binding protein
MKIVSNTSPLIGFSKIERLDILEELFQSIIIPQIVYDEFFDNCAPTEETHFFSAYQKFIKVVKLHSSYTFSRRLDQGEQDVLALALQEHADILLIDDRKAFNEAQEHHLVAASTRTVLRMAEEKHIIASYQELEDALRKKSFFLPHY